VPHIPRDVEGLSAWLGIPSLPHLISQFLYEQEHPELDVPPNQIPLEACPIYSGKVFVYPSAVATYFAPSDISGVGGMIRERIRSTRSWMNGPARRDCVYVEHDANLPGFRGLYVAQVLAFLKLKHNGITYPCAVVSWFSAIGDSACPDTGMWMVTRDIDGCGKRVLSIIHLETILRTAHLIGVAGKTSVPVNHHHSQSLNVFKSFYVNKYVDYHAHEIAF
jgi:hypothetical protein